MAFNYEDWVITMEKKYGPGWRTNMGRIGAKGGKAKVSKGFGRMTPEQRQAAGRKGALRRWSKDGL